ncbi:ABC transporter ATP-binding protein [Alkalilimnicola ehrlichii]|uniref:ABC transporter ATP-binding protein n=1 Tax=Alkalilimnicola ehrlichii TaxID=351052 RepID=A0A3E0WTW7_9GAMM|nr:ABC transporter ATP-binding protein [Alkalilimnicola ehrlichii]RFA29832.1 ABC transporter ATP-binding protein [Alkalilimnicola ehrlichii]RFA36420.1 ABC transporter ATP-binding protein [Alkalilimnicola ehrlichii]
MALVELTAIERRYREGERERCVLSGVDVAIDQGERVALVGRSGSGKSTLLNLIGGIDRPDRGRVRIADTDLTALDETARTLFRRHHIGFVFQFFNLLPTLTVAENLLLPLELTGETSQARRQEALDLLERVGLGDRGNSYPERLSGGEQQRVAIARALVHRPSLLLADEPTGTLDWETGERVLDVLFELSAVQGMTLLIVTHSDEVAERADRVLRLHEGRLQDEAGR